jgi:DNA replication protein DnaC
MLSKSDHVAVEECHPPDGIFCDHGWHFRRSDGFAVRRCEVAKGNARRATVESWRERLGGPIEKLRQWGGLDERGLPTFAGYDANRHEGAARGLGVMRSFASSRPPMNNVILVGSNGLGKSRLLLTSHFALLEAGIASQYVTTPELRLWFHRQQSFDEEVSREARGKLAPLLYAQAIHFDDPGEVEDDQRRRGEFTEGLKCLLDNSRAVWAVATNRSADEMERHPDLSGSIASRFQLGAEVVVMRGLDYRVETAR